MTDSVVVWDQKRSNQKNCSQAVFYWQSYTNDLNGASIPAYLEVHADRLKAKYLEFIHDLGEQQLRGKSVIEHFVIDDGFSFWWMTLLAEKSTLKSPHIYDCLRLMALEELLLQSKPTNLSLVTSDKNLVNAIRILCKNLTINFTWEIRRTKKKLHLRQLFRVIPIPVQGLISFLGYIFSRWPLKRVKSPVWHSGNNAVFLCSYFIHLDPNLCSRGRFYSRQWGMLPKLLHLNGFRTNWIQHFLFSSTVPSVDHGIKWLDLFNNDSGTQGLHSFLDSYLTFSIVIKVFKNWAKMYICSWRLRKIHTVFHPRNSAACFWPILKKDWSNYISGIGVFLNLLWFELLSAALKDLPHQPRGLYLCENQGWERALLHIWKVCKHGQIIGVQHATVPFWHLYYFDDARTLTSKKKYSMPLPDFLAVNGPDPRKFFLESGYPAEKVIDTEALRYMNLFDREKILKSNTSQNDLEGRQKNKDKGKKTNILVLGDLNNDSSHALLHLLEETIKSLPPAFDFSFKPHPSSSIRLLDYPGIVAEETSDSLDTILGNFDIAMAANVTSASVDAYMSGLEVVIHLDGTNFNLSPLRGYTDVSFVSSSEELTNILIELNTKRKIIGRENNLFYTDSSFFRWSNLLRFKKIIN